VPFSRAGCNVDAVAMTGFVLENTTTEVAAAFGPHPRLILDLLNGAMLDNPSATSAKRGMTLANRRLDARLIDGAYWVLVQSGALATQTTSSTRPRAVLPAAARPVSKGCCSVPTRWLCG
jgi:hypothetical protein